MLHAMQAICIGACTSSRITTPTQTLRPKSHDQLNAGEDAAEEDEEPETLVRTRRQRNSPFLQEFFPMKAQILPR